MEKLGAAEAVKAVANRYCRAAIDNQEQQNMVANYELCHRRMS
jgi:hypothetical protein